MISSQYTLESFEKVTFSTEVALATKPVESWKEYN